MKSNNIKSSLLTVLFFLIFSASWAQSVTRVSGKIYDAQTKELLPLVDVGFLGTSVGTSTDLDGYYSLETRFPSDTLIVNYLGYQVKKVKIQKGKSQSIDFYLTSSSQVINTVTLSAKKEKYSKKNNPSLELAKKVMANRDANRLKGQDHLQYEKYEKIRLDVNNITEQFKSRPVINKMDFLWQFVDTSSVNGKTYLPIFIREILSTYYYRKSSNTEREYRHAVKFSQITNEFDPKSINAVLDILYIDMDIYESTIEILDAQFTSPLSNAAIDYYRFYIVDTINVDGKSLINLSFIPAVKGNLGFTGNMYISNDDRYTVMKVDMGVINGINLNFVRDLRIIQEYAEKDNQFIKSRDEVTIDYALTQNGVGSYGTRTVNYSDFKFNVPADPKIFAGTENVVLAPDFEKGEDYWQEKRIQPLNKSDQDLYTMVDLLRKDPTFNAFVYLTRVALTGYIPIGKVEFGPLATFVSFNDVEGTQLRFGGGTTFGFSKKIRLQGYGAYTTRMKRFKYSAGLTYTFNEDYKVNPRHFIRLSADRESIFPGQDLAFFSPDNFLLSFRRGQATKMLFNDTYKVHYEHEGEGFSYYTTLSHRRREAIGSLNFNYRDLTLEQDLDLGMVNTTEVSVGFRYAPNEQYIQGKENRIPLFNEYPVFKFEYTRGIDGVLGGNYSFDRVYLNIFKQFKWTTWGKTDVIVEGGKIWGEVPYILRFVPRGNQTYAYQLASYNLMNFMEFSAEQFASINIEHYFYGKFLNRIPLLKKLKLREVATFKMLVGSTSDRYNPNLNPDQVQLPKDATGNPTTFLFDNRPYMEASIGFTNIFKILRVDVVRRFNYLENPNMATLFGAKGWGIRARFFIEF